MIKPQTLNSTEAAQYLGVSTRTIKVYAASGRIQAQKIAGSWAISKEALDRFIKGETGRTQKPDQLAAYLSGLAAALRDLLAHMEQTQASPEAIADLEDIIQMHIEPMEAAISRYVR